MTTCSDRKICCICSIVKIIYIRKHGYFFFEQKNTHRYYMNAYICHLKENNDAAGNSNQSMSKLNQYAANPNNRMIIFYYVEKLRNILKTMNFMH